MTTKLEQLRNELKTLSEVQTVTKEQRKTVTFKGTRTMTTSEATWRVQANTNKLRYLHVAYSMMLGNDYSNIESNPREEINMNEVNNLIAKYSEEVVHSDS